MMINGTSNIGTMNGTHGAFPMGGLPPIRNNKAMAPVAKALGMSVDDLSSALEGGQTLDQLATSKGVSSDNLLQAVGHGMVLNTYA